tara:strand:+ start:95 stop:421 length:327 start_codon:yes stop_codon:yes gene_type:complete
MESVEIWDKDLNYFIRNYDIEYIELLFDIIEAYKKNYKKPLNSIMNIEIQEGEIWLWIESDDTFIHGYLEQALDYGYLDYNNDMSQEWFDDYDSMKKEQIKMSKEYCN